MNLGKTALFSLIRSDIDKIDAMLMELFKQRSECVTQLAEVKRQVKMPAYDAKRELIILDKIKKNNNTHYSDDDLAQIFKSIFQAGINQQMKTNQGQ